MFSADCIHYGSIIFNYSLIRSLYLLIHFRLLFVYVTGNPSARFDQRGIVPVNKLFISDDDPDTCANFNIGVDIHTPRDSTFRIEVADDIKDYANVTLIGNNLGCGHNLYVTPLSAAETEKWTGRWTTCSLKEESMYGDKEICSYNCLFTGSCEEMQVMKSPRIVEDSSWTVCHVCITPGLFNRCMQNLQ